MTDPSDSRRSADTRASIANTEADQRSSPSGIVVEVFVEDDGWSAIEDVATKVHRAATALSISLLDEVNGQSAAIALSNDIRIAELNGTYRGKHTPTNVLSFPSARTPALAAEELRSANEPVFIGDIILAVETVMREASELRRPPEQHLQHLVVHGLLHLLGYDHETEKDARHMEGLETKILEHIGVPNPHSGDDHAVEPQQA